MVADRALIHVTFTADPFRPFPSPGRRIPRPETTAPDYFRAGVRQAGSASFIVLPEESVPAPTGRFPSPADPVIPRGRNDDVAQQTTITLVDDLDGTEADEQVEFSVDGRAYEIDLSAGNAEKLRESLAPYVAAARRGSGRRGPASGASSSNGSSSSERAANRAVREWAVAQGMKISERGRIPSSVLEAYQNAHS
ncbi:hypothetical protein GCM10009629_50700 [Pseudonocardia alni]